MLIDYTGLQQLLERLDREAEARRREVADLDARLAALEAADDLSGFPKPDGSTVPAGMRGMWIQNTSDPQTARARVARAADLGANTVYWFCGTGARVRFRNSQGVPATELLDDVVDQAQQRGVAVYACLPLKYFTRSDHPEQNLKGRISGCDEDWLDFRVPAAREFVAALARDLATNYPVHVILDYCRYHRSWFPAARDAGLLGTDEITETIRAVRLALPPGALLAASPMGRLDDSPWSAANNGQDWPAWLRQDLVDWLSPMCYQDAPFLRDRIAEWQATGCYPARICPLLSIEQALQPPQAKTAEGWRAELRAALESGARGLAVFDESLSRQYPALAAVLRDGW